MPVAAPYSNRSTIDPWPSEPDRLAAVAAHMAEAKSLQGVINAAEAQLTALIATIADLQGSPNGGPRRTDDSKLSHSPGFRSFNHELTHELGLSITQARHLIEVASRRNELPLLAKAADEGRINTRAAATMTEVATAENEEGLVDLLDTATIAQIGRVCKSYKKSVESNKPDPEDGDTPADNREYLNLTPIGEEGWSLDGWLGGADGERFRQALNEKRAELFRRSGLPASNVDALRAIIEEGPTGSGADAYLTLINVDLAAYRAGEPGAGRVVGGPVLTPEELARILEDCSTTLIINHNGHPVWVSDKARTPPPWMRRLLRSRDYECAIAGCNASGYLEAHHLIPYVTRPLTDYGVLRLLCGFHHGLLHRLGLTVTHDPETDELTLRWADGSPVANPATAGPTPARPADVAKRTSTSPGQDQQQYDPLTHYGLDTLVGHLAYLDNPPKPRPAHSNATPAAQSPDPPEPEPD